MYSYDAQYVALLDGCLECPLYPSSEPSDEPTATPAKSIGYRLARLCGLVSRHGRCHRQEKLHNLFFSFSAALDRAKGKPIDSKP